MAKKKTTDNQIANNRKAFFNYEIVEDFEAGMVLLSSEVKSLRKGEVNISDSYADIRYTESDAPEVWLLNLNISIYKNARKNHEPTRMRKLLLKKREIKSLIGKLEKKGFSLVPLSLYFNKKGFVKVKMGLGKGKAKHDKRETIKQRDWDREKRREIKNS